LSPFHPGNQVTAQDDHLDAGLCDCLREVLDPEIGLNVVDLGLVILAERTPEAVKVRLTLTSRACPLGEMVLDDVRQKVAQSYPEVARMDIQLVWDPVWTPDRITDRGYELLGRTRTRTLI
jgi:metal-sulfur cluster biosynthetic enzyme